jgi:hypothetical protein
MPICIVVIFFNLQYLAEILLIAKADSVLSTTPLMVIAVVQVELSVEYCKIQSFTCDWFHVLSGCDVLIGDIFIRLTVALPDISALIVGLDSITEPQTVVRMSPSRIPAPVPSAPA